MDVSSFAALLGAPRARPVPVDWDVVETWLGLSLPSDYKALVSAYGPLDIGEFVWLHSPCVEAGRFEYAAWLTGAHRDCRISARSAPPYELPEFHPAVGGLLAWGETRSCSYLFWDTSASGDPDQWPVVLFDEDAVPRGLAPWRDLGAPLFETLAALVRTGLPLPSGGRLGPLPATAKRTAFLSDARPWSPPEPKPEVVPKARRRTALTEGRGLETLSILVPPPEAPYLGTGMTWDELFETLGTRLPSEYVSLMERYGAGCWSKWLRFAEPLGAGDFGLVREVRWRLDAYRGLRAEFPEYNPLEVWPESGGFLPFADSIDGDELGWLTEGDDPDQWSLVVHPRHADQGPPLDGTLTGTLLEWSRGNLRTEGLPGLDPLDDPLDFIDFEPIGNDPED